MVTNYPRQLAAAAELTYERTTGVVARAMGHANAVLNGADEVDLGGTIAPAQLQHIARHRNFLRNQFRTG